MSVLEKIDSKSCSAEIWADITGYEGLYQVSTEGRVRSLGNDKTRKTKILKARNAAEGYLFVSLSKDGKVKQFLVHRLVAGAFLYCENRDSLDINHRDEDKENNRVENLEYCTRAYNINFGTRNQRVAEKKSKQVNQLTLSGDLIKTWPSSAEAGRNGFTHSAVAACCRGEAKTHKGYIWQYA